MKKKVFVISHTHWDREWYLRKETFLMMLVELVDDLLKVLDEQEDFKIFMLDGQTIALEDYLAIRPNQEERLRNYIKEGRILIGPWYVLPDEYLISGEGHIRNYLYGERWCERMGAKMQVGYLPDSFGHPSQMPQILKGLGLNEIIFWRGLGEDINETELYWEGLDGTLIKGVNMPYGYGMGANLPKEEEAFVERVGSIIERLEPLTRTNSILLMQGVDHTGVMAELPQLLDVARESFPEYEFIHGSLRDYVDSIPEDLSYGTTKGELRSGYKAYLLGGTISTRMYLKQENFFRERELINYVEPLAALATILADQNYPKDLIDHAWKIYLQNMPHDSICGCSIDEVHDEMMIRYQDLADTNRYLLDKSLAALSKEISGKESSILLFNPRPIFSANETVTLTLVYEKHLIRKVNYSNSVLEENYPEFEKEEPTGIEVLASNGQWVAGRIIAISETDEAMDIFMERQPEMFLEKHIEVELPVSEEISVGLATMEYRWTYAALEDKSEPNAIENDFIRIEVDQANSKLLIHNKASEAKEVMSLTIVDSGDAGDEYTFSPPLNDETLYWEIQEVNTERQAMGSTMQVRGILELPVGLSEDYNSRLKERVKCPFDLSLFLADGSSRVESEFIFDNQAEYHQLSVQLNVGQGGDYSYAESLFGVDKREVLSSDNQDYAEWVEAPSTYAHKTFVAVKGDNGVAAIANRGLPAFEAFKEKDGSTVIMLTLLRGVGWLSRYDLRARKGNGGWSLRTPGAQCLGTHKFEFALIFGEQAMPLEAVVQSAHAYAFPILGYQVESGAERGELEKFNFVRADSQAVVLTAVKRAERGEGWICRLYNSAEEEQAVKFTFAPAVKGATFVNFAEEQSGEELQLVDGELEVNFKPWQIKSIYLTTEG